MYMKLFNNFKINIPVMHKMIILYLALMCVNYHVHAQTELQHQVILLGNLMGWEGLRLDIQCQSF